MQVVKPSRKKIGGIGNNVLCGVDGIKSYIGYQTMTLVVLLMYRMNYLIREFKESAKICTVRYYDILDSGYSAPLVSESLQMLTFRK
jgi:hypothetical protein